jgi:hypothetical protein
MNVEHSVGPDLVGETEVLGETLPQFHWDLASNLEW